MGPTTRADSTPSTGSTPSTVATFRERTTFLLACVGPWDSRGSGVNQTEGGPRPNSPPVRYTAGVNDVHYVLLSAALCWLMVMTAAELRTPTWTREGARLAFGNREALPEPSPLAGRAARAASNMIENLVIFVAVYAAARAAHPTGHDLTRGAAIFFWARLAYFPVYLVGIPYLRSALWGVSLLGVVLLGLAAVR